MVDSVPLITHLVFGFFLNNSFQVEYQCEGFLEKNKDTVYEEQIKVLKSSKVSIRILLFFSVVIMPWVMHHVKFFIKPGNFSSLTEDEHSLYHIYLFIHLNLGSPVA